MVRDACIVSVTTALWYMPEGTGAFELLLGLMTGLSALLFHEWGHLLGAALGSARVKPTALWSPFIFDLDSRSNGRRQFLSVSLWGFAATAVYLLLFFSLLPQDRLAGQVAQWSGLFLATLTVLIEFPIAFHVYRGGAIPPVEIFKRR